MRTLVIVPTYNERENIPVLIQRVMKNNDCDMLFVDDNSPDKTNELVKEFMKTNTKINIIERKGKLGLGTAYKEGFAYALEKGYEKIVMMDADLSHPPEKISEMLNKTGADLVVGSRYIKDGGIAGWPWQRHVLSKGANLYAYNVLRNGIHDLTAGFICLRREVLMNIDLNGIHGEGYAFLIELKHNAYLQGFRPAEIPIIFKERERGVSKINRGIIWEAFWLVLRLKFKKRR